jgi:hypothetical protein
MVDPGARGRPVIVDRTYPGGTDHPRCVLEPVGQDGPHRGHARWGMPTDLDHRRIVGRYVGDSSVEAAEAARRDLGYAVGDADDLGIPAFLPVVEQTQAQPEYSYVPIRHALLAAVQLRRRSIYRCPARPPTTALYGS